MITDFPRVEIGPENPLRLEKEGSVTLQCNVEAKPRVNSVRWERNGRFIATTFTYALQKVTVADAGEYTCSADNGLGQPGMFNIFVFDKYYILLLFYVFDLPET